ncbi:MAG: hypothetical protein ACEY29_01330 [Arsenophonus sp.]
MLKSIYYRSLILAIFGSTAAGLTAIVHTITKNIINIQTVTHEQKFFNQIITHELYYNNLTKVFYCRKTKMKQ